MKIVCAFLSVICFLGANPTVTENDPSTIVNGVSMITGDLYTLDEDLVVAGAEPIHLKRGHLSSVGDWMPYDHLQVELLTKEYLFVVHEPNGTKVHYQIPPYHSKKKDLKPIQCPCTLVQSHGVTNTASGKIAAQTNYQNQYIVVEKDKKSITLHCANGTKRRYKASKNQKPENTGIGYEFFHFFYHLQSEELPNGNTIHYVWDDRNNLSSILTKSPTGKIYASIIFSKVSDKNPIKPRKILGSDRQELGYEYHYVDFLKDKYPMLKAVEPPDEPKRIFSHRLKKHDREIVKIKRPYLEKINLPNGREVYIDYEKYFSLSGKRHYRVKQLYSPIGEDLSLQVSHTFSYFPEARNSSVVDAQGNKTEYFWNTDERLTRIDYYAGTNLLDHSEKFNWDGTRLKCKSLFDQNRNPISANTYEYDNRGNVTSETFLGQLTGNGFTLQIDDQGYFIDNGVEKCIKKTTYSNDGKDLPIKQEESSGLTTMYEYYPNSHLLKTKILCDQTIPKIYHHYEYNEDLLLIREITDDGLSKTIRQITPKAQVPYLGMPEIIEEKYEFNGHEILLSKTVLYYGTGGRIYKKEIYDANNSHRYNLEYSYDFKGRLERETNAFGGESINRYDALGNCTYQKDFNGFETFQDFDAANRVIKKEGIGSDGIRNVITYKYDKLHNLVSETNSKGHTTYYTPTLIGKRSKTQLPSFANDQGILITPILQSSFDNFGNEITSTDADGFSTYTEYNAYGKPTKIHHPNGAHEIWKYNVDGTLQSHTDAMGVITAYACDYLGRLLHKTISQNNVLLAEEKYQYIGHQLISKIDIEGNQTTYTYDRAGRKTSETSGPEIIAFKYDEFSRNHITEQGLLRTVRQFDLLGKIEELRDEDISTNHYLRKTVYHYDRANNKIATFRWINESQTQICERFKFDSQNRLITKIDSKGHTNTISYDDHHMNHHQQKVLQTTHTDAMGLQIIETFDTHGHITKIEKNKNGKTLSIEERFTNARGKTTLQINTIMAPNQANRSIWTRWEYDSCGRPIKIIEASETNDAKITTHTYNFLGKKETTTKPDGCVLTFAYSPLGFLEHLISSDETVNHHMRYDKLGNLLWHDGIHRAVDFKGRLIKESFPYCSIQNTYNKMGQRITCSSQEANFLIEYEFSGLDLTFITRKTFSGEDQYTYQYLKRDLSGNLLGATLPNNLGQIKYQYDLNSNRQSIEVQQFHQRVLETDPAGNILHLETQNQLSNFTYDDLYQLTSETGLFNHTYAYDSLHCRLTKDSVQYQINALNQVISHLTYDENGNSLQSGDTHYSWDALDRLITIQTPEYLQKFTYDSQHRRLSTTTFHDLNEKTDYYLYDGQNEIGSFNSSLQMKDFRVLGFAPHAEIDATITIELKNKNYATIHDLSGNIAMLVPFDGSEPLETRFSAFGEETGSDLSPWRFSSKRIDAQTGLIYYGRRFYQSDLGRWLSPDPAGFTDGMNLYAFVHNSPLTHFDEYGLLDLGQWEKTSEQRHSEQNGIIWGASRWARSFTSSAIHTVAFASQLMLCQPFGLANLANQFERSINRSISRLTGYIAPYQFGNFDFNR